VIGYIGLILYLVFSVFRPQDWYTSLEGLPADYISYSIILIGCVASGSRFFAVLASSQFRLILVYVIVCLASVIVNGAFHVLSEQAISMVNLMLAFVGFAVCVKSPTGLTWLCVLVVLMTGIIAWQGQMMVQTGVGLAGQSLYWAGRIRWVGMYDGANVLSMLFVLALAFSFQILLGPWGFIPKILILPCVVLIIQGMYLANSRGGYLALLAVVATTVLLRGRNALQKIRPGRLAVAGIAVFLLLMVAPSRLESINDKEHSTSGRIDAWQEGLEMLRSNPVLGVGKGLWREHHFRLAHNSLVQTMGESGFVGLFVYLSMFTAAFKTLFRLIRDGTDPKRKSAAAMLFTAFAGYFTCSFFITTTQFDWPYVLMGATFGLGFDLRDEVALKRADLTKLMAATFVVVLSIYLTVRIFYSVT
jgi:hypothetical protein